jgi:hypothetical protein
MTQVEESYDKVRVLISAGFSTPLPNHELI